MVGEAVASVRAQILPSRRIIVVDDGSDEPASIALLDALEADGDVTVVRQANAGVSAARNRGIALTEAPYVLILDGDDRLLPNFSQRTSAALDACGDVVAASGWLRTFGVLSSTVCPTGGGAAAFVARNCCPATCMVRRDAWEACGGYDESMRGGFEDWDFFLSLLESGRTARIDVVPEELIEYRTASSSSNVASMERRPALMRYLIGKHHDLYTRHVADAVLGVEAASIGRLAMWEEQAGVDGVGALSGRGRDFMASPSYGDGGMAAAVRLAANGSH